MSIDDPGDAVRMACLQRETCAPVLQGDPCAGDNDSRPEPFVIGLDEGDHHPVVIGGRQIDGAAVRGDNGNRR